MDLTQATIIGDKIRNIHSQQAMQICNHKMTLSIGIAALQKNDNTSSLYKHADDAPYHAKHNGRNIVSTNEEPVTL